MTVGAKLPSSTVSPPQNTPEGEIILSLQGVSKRYGAVQAVRDITLECRAGEIHAVVGENGSGKSTLLGIASGSVEQDKGRVFIGGKPLRTDSPAKALRLGLGMAYQDNAQVLGLARGSGISTTITSTRPASNWMKRWK